MKYLVSSPRLILTEGSPPSRPHWTANLPCKAPCISRNMRIQQHKTLLPPLPTTTLAIIINWVQRMGQKRREGTPDCLVRWGQKKAREWSKTDARRANTPPLGQMGRARHALPCPPRGTGPPTWHRSKCPDDLLREQCKTYPCRSPLSRAANALVPSDVERGVHLHPRTPLPTRWPTLRWSGRNEACNSAQCTRQGRPEAGENTVQDWLAKASCWGVRLKEERYSPARAASRTLVAAHELIVRAPDVIDMPRIAPTIG